MLPNLGGTELIILLVIILLLFGASRIPGLARSLGSGVREFRKGTSGDYDEVDEEKKKSSPPGTAQARAASRRTPPPRQSAPSRRKARTRRTLNPAWQAA